MVTSHDKKQVIRRDDGSFVADGINPMPDLRRAPGIDGWPQTEVMAVGRYRVVPLMMARGVEAS